MADLNNQTITPGQEPQTKRDLKQAQKSPALPSGQQSLAQDANRMKQTQTNQMAAIRSNPPPTEKEQARQLQAKRNKSKQKAAKEGEGGEGEEGTKGMATKGAQKFTAKALKQSWLNLIDTCGLTLLYINFHFLGKYVAGSSLFSEFGAEWAPQKAVQAGGEMGKTATGAAKFAEIIVLFLLDFLLVMLAAFILMVALAPVFLAAGVLQVLKGAVGL